MGTSRQPSSALVPLSGPGVALGPLLLLLEAGAPSAPGVLLSTSIGSDWLEGPSKAVTCWGELGGWVGGGGWEEQQ